MILAKAILETLFNQGADGLLISDGSGLVIDCNFAFAQLTGYKCEEIKGCYISKFLDFGLSLDGDEQESKSGTYTQVSSEPHNATVFCHNGLGLIMPVSYLSFSANAEQVQYYLTIVYIVQSHNVQQAQTEFVSTVSHELRTPLTSIKGFADTILRAGSRLDSSQQRRYIGIIKEQADRLTRLVEDLLAVSRLESKNMQLTVRAINFEETVQRVIQNLADKARQHNMLVRIPPGLPLVWADGDRLEQILTNLIDNAIKYSPEGTTISVTARSCGQNPEMVEFSINDQGGGIAPEHINQIFNKFNRLDNPLTRQTEGTGLGLYITKSLIVALDGKIAVSSSPGSTTFTVQLPTATLEQQAARGRG